MKFTVSSSALLSVLSMTGKVINNKSSLPILEHFLMELKDGVLRVTASDSETTLIGTLEVENVEQLRQRYSSMYSRSVQRCL